MEQLPLVGRDGLDELLPLQQAEADTLPEVRDDPNDLDDLEVERLDDARDVLAVFRQDLQVLEPVAVLGVPDGEEPSMRIIFIGV
ncbi:hypothetical protein VB773_19130 [Haloarculaceae archaeon H-GB2-1]|nr:hypothetical protein [Haloarculaceae archaeon H-GB2-1]